MENIIQLFCNINCSMGDEGVQREIGQVNKGGRPRKKSKLSINTGRKRTNDECSTSTLYRRAHEIISKYDTKAIELAFKLIQNKTACDGIVENPEKQLSVFSHESAFALYLDYNFNKENYIALVNDTQLRNCPIYPFYYFITQEMNKYKPEKYIIITETEVTVSLQSMLNNTAEHLCEGIAFNWEKSVLRSLELVVTVGFDSSSGHTNPHQKYDSTENQNANAQQSLFVTSMVIILVRSKKSNENLWVNPKPQSVRLCRPLRVCFEKEDDVAILREFKRLNEEISSLKPYNFTMPNQKSVRITFNVSQTLFDGKCVNTIVGNKATSRCPMCLRTAHEFGDLNDDFKPNQSSLIYGLGLLHCTIKCFEHLLHLSYKKDFVSWSVGPDKKGITLITIELKKYSSLM